MNQIQTEFATNYPRTYRPSIRKMPGGGLSGNDDCHGESRYVDAVAAKTCFSRTSQTPWNLYDLQRDLPEKRTT